MLDGEMRSREVIRELEKRNELPFAFWFSLICSMNGTSPNGLGIVRQRDWFIVNGN